MSVSQKGKFCAPYPTGPLLAVSWKVKASPLCPEAVLELVIEGKAAAPRIVKTALEGPVDPAALLKVTGTVKLPGVVGVPTNWADIPLEVGQLVRVKPGGKLEAEIEAG